MKVYIFAASDQPAQVASASLEALADSCAGYSSVVLESDSKLRLLLQLLGINVKEQTVPTCSKSFSAVFDFSEEHWPHLGQAQFDNFFEDWLRISGRDRSMDEYGQLVFLQEAVDWTKKTYRFVLCERL
ncbi:hypothetical protein JQR88_23465 (plasmid) [Pseudomonas luteola]|uniref:hypothetical protein n=1 Tax=Pseudomonas luteola TaxID=47886 RepID=UPI003DA0629D